MQRVYDDLGLRSAQRTKLDVLLGMNVVGWVEYRTSVLHTHWILTGRTQVKWYCSFVILSRHACDLQIMMFSGKQLEALV